MNDKKKIRVLFCCMGNICRSPTAHGVFRQLVNEAGLQDQIEIDSAGTHAYHIGHPPDKRAQQTARSRGIELSDLRARQVATEDFTYYDYILAMDEDNHRLLSQHSPKALRGKIHFFLAFAANRQEIEVPDPYYGGEQGFEHVFELVDTASRGLLDDISNKCGLSPTSSPRKSRSGR